MLTLAINRRPPNSLPRLAVGSVLGVGCCAAASAPPRDTFNEEKCEKEQREDGRVSSGGCPVARGACAHPPPPAAHCSDRPTLPSRRQSSARARPDCPSRRPLLKFKPPVTCNRHHADRAGPRLRHAVLLPHVQSARAPRR